MISLFIPIAQEFPTTFSRLSRFFKIICSHTIFLDVAYRNFKAERERKLVDSCEVGEICWMSFARVLLRALGDLCISRELNIV